jgi:hypothetical protein
MKGGGAEGQREQCGNSALGWPSACVQVWKGRGTRARVHVRVFTCVHTCACVHVCVHVQMRERMSPRARPWLSSTLETTSTSCSLGTSVRGTRGRVLLPCVFMRAVPVLYARSIRVSCVADAWWVHGGVCVEWGGGFELDLPRRRRCSRRCVSAVAASAPATCGLLPTLQLAQCDCCLLVLAASCGR